MSSELSVYVAFSIATSSWATATVEHEQSLDNYKTKLQPLIKILFLSVANAKSSTTKKSKHK